MSASHGNDVKNERDEILMTSLSRATVVAQKARKSESIVSFLKDRLNARSTAAAAASRL